MKSNSIQFAVVREDSRLECDLVRRHGIKKILTIGSGGCTALNLAASFPDIQITVLDPNEAQLDLIERKVKALQHKNHSKFKAAFNIEDQDPRGLSQCGNFEFLFRSFRLFLNEFVAWQEEWERFFSKKTPEDFLKAVFANKYWSIAFQLSFSDELLKAIFGPAAVQNGSGSYALYFQNLLERGLKNASASNNYFLHHIFLGNYLDRKNTLPDFLCLKPTKIKFQYLCSNFNDRIRLKDFDLVNLSNIFDWMSDDESANLFHFLKKSCPKGTFLMLRQLNNAADFKSRLSQEFRFDQALEETEQRRDRSLFYSKIYIGYKTE